MEEQSAATDLSLNLDGEDLDCHVFVHYLGLPDRAEAPPGLHLQQLQGLETQQGGSRRGARILEDREEGLITSLK